MRYIPNLAANVIVQVPEDKNAYINIRNIGASGRGDLEFTGTITDIQGGIVTISSIDDGDGNTLFQYSDVFKSGAGIQLFAYGAATTPEPPILSVTSNIKVGVDFSSSPSTNSNLAPLRYYVFGFDPQTGRLPNFRSVVEIGTKVLNPDLWNTEQYVQLTFSRTSQYALPVIYRVWGNRVDFLGVIGNNKVGYPGSGSVVFRDLGNIEIPSWDIDPVLPTYLSDVFSVSGPEVVQTRTVTGRELVEIIPNPVGSQPAYIQCTGLSVTSQLQPGSTVRFTIDDTGYFRTALSLAASSSIKDVFFPAGTYNISDTNFVNTSGSDYSNITLRGVGDGSILRRLPCTLGNPSNPGLLNFTGQSVSPRVSGIRIRSMAIDGNRGETFSQVSPIETEVGIRIQYADNVVISDCTVTGCGGGGIALYNTNGASLTYNSIRVSGRSYEQSVSPLVIDTCENIVAQGNRMELATTGPKVITTEFSTINGNIVRGCGDRGIDISTSSQWNVQGNLAYSDNDSIIQSIDTYNNEYSRATIEVRKGFALDPVYMTVTVGGESVSIVKNSIRAEIFTLNSTGVKITPAIGSFRVLETAAQLDAGIFSLTLPGTTSATFGDDTLIPATGTLSSTTGYVYEVKADILIGQSFTPLSISSETVNGNPYVAITLRNSSDLLGFRIYSESSAENDRIRIGGFTNTGLSVLDPNTAYTVVGISTDSNSLLLSPIAGLSLSTTPIEFTGSPRVLIQRSDYFVADGNLFVHTF
jgi:parallel beta-helix repeat protein